MAESKDSPKSTRKVKSPETFRERAIKASEQDETSGRGRRLKTAAGNPARKSYAAAQKVGNNKFVRIITWPFRILGRILFPKYIRNSFQELKLVHWPNRRETLRLTFAVLVFALIFALVVSGIDFVLDKLFREVLLT